VRRPGLAPLAAAFFCAALGLAAWAQHPPHDGSPATPAQAPLPGEPGASGPPAPLPSRATTAKAHPLAAGYWKDHLQATFASPRCTNCHGFNTETSKKKKGSIRQRHDKGQGLFKGFEDSCFVCHGKIQAGWRAPNADADFLPLTAPGADPAELCAKIKEHFEGAASAPGRGRSPAGQALHHLQNDKLIEWGFVDGRVPSLGGDAKKLAVPGVPAFQQWLADTAVWASAGMPCR